MSPPPPTYSAIALEDGAFYQHDNKNIDDNNHTAKPEDNTFARAGKEEEGAPEITEREHVRPTIILRKLIFEVCILFLTIWATGCALTRHNHNSYRAKEALFRADCGAAGGRIEVQQHSVPGWGVDRVDCLHGEGEENRSLEMSKGQVIVCT